MSDLISRQAAIDEANAWLLDCFKVQKQDRSCGLIRRLEDLPCVTEAEDVAPVVHAHWETDKHAALDFCSSCGEAVERYVTAEQMDRSNYKGETFWNYCPHCGAKMDEEEGNDE